VKQRLYLFASLFLFLFASASRLSAQEENKVIVRDFKWGVYATRHFDIYYYGESKEWLPFVAETLETAYKKVSADLNPCCTRASPSSCTLP